MISLSLALLGVSNALLNLVKAAVLPINALFLLNFSAWRNADSNNFYLALEKRSLFDA
jgi:hypothetical protein